jgi:hypothetical protein
MKKCPSCGYEDTPTERQLLRQYKKAFGDIPVRVMIKRCWINVSELASVEEVRAELIRFFELKDAEELDAFVRGELDPLERMLGRPPAASA